MRPIEKRDGENDKNNSHMEEGTPGHHDDFVDLPRFQRAPVRIFCRSEIHCLGRSSCSHTLALLERIPGDC